MLRRAKTAGVLRVPTVDSTQSADTREAKIKRNGVNICNCCCCYCRGALVDFKGVTIQADTVKFVFFC